MFSCLQILEAFLWFVLITLLNVTLIILTLSVSRLDRKSGSAGMPRPSSYAAFCWKKKNVVTRRARCRLGDGSHFTDVEIRLAPAHFVPDRLDGALDVAPLSGPVTLRCRSDGATGDVQARHIRITLIRPGTLIKVNMSSGTRTTTGSGIPDIVHGFLFGPVPVPGASALGTVARLHVGRGRWAALAARWPHGTPSGATQR